MSQPLTLIIPGPPRTKKNSGTIMKVGKRTIIRPSDAWMAWRNQVIEHGITVFGLLRTKRLHGQGEVLCPTGDYNASARIYRDANRGDAVGYYQGIADVLEELKIVTDDKQITQWDGSRLCVDRANPRVEVVFTPIEDTP